MLFAGKTVSGTHLWPRWWCFLFGGNFRQREWVEIGFDGKEHNCGGGYGWTPGVYWLTKRYFCEGWYKHRSWWDFVKIDV